MTSEEDELILCGAAVIILDEINRRRRRRSRRWWVKEYYRRRGGNDMLNELNFEDSSGFRNFTRMSPSDFEILVNMIGPFVSKKDTNFRKAIPVNQKLAVTLRFLATGDSYQSLAYLFHISKPAISKIVPAVCEVLVDGLKHYVKVMIKTLKNDLLVIKIQINIINTKISNTYTIINRPKDANHFGLYTDSAALPDFLLS